MFRHSNKWRKLFAYASYRSVSFEWVRKYFCVYYDCCQYVSYASDNSLFSHFHSFFLFLSIWYAFAHLFCPSTHVYSVYSVPLFYGHLFRSYTVKKNYREHAMHIYNLCVEFDLVYFLSCLLASILIHWYLKVLVHTYVRWNSTCQHTYVPCTQQQQHSWLNCVRCVFVCERIQHIFRLMSWYNSNTIRLCICVCASAALSLSPTVEHNNITNTQTHREKRQKQRNLLNTNTKMCFIACLSMGKFYPIQM